MDGGCDIVNIDVEVSVRPMQGVWECCDRPKIKKETREGAVVLKGSQSVMFCKELPTTSKATSGPYKNFDYNISSTTASSNGSSFPTPRSWKKFTHTKKDKSDERKKKKRHPFETKIVEPKSGAADSRKEIKKTESKKNTEKSIIPKSGGKEPLIKQKEEDKTMKKEEPMPVKCGGWSFELECWMVLALLWFYILIWRYFHVLQMENL